MYGRHFGKLLGLIVEWCRMRDSVTEGQRLLPFAYVSTLNEHCSLPKGDHVANTKEVQTQAR